MNAQGFVVNDELLLHISEGIRTVRSFNTCYSELLEVFSLCAVVEQFGILTNSSPVVPL